MCLSNGVIDGQPEPAGEGLAAEVRVDNFSAKLSAAPFPSPVLSRAPLQTSTSVEGDNGASPKPCPGAGLFTCSYPGCGATFKRRYDITVHLRVHTNERPYVCDYPDCGMAFKTTSACNAHMLIHSGCRPYVCIHAGCGATFAQKSSCTRHYRLKHRKRPAGCRGLDVSIDAKPGQLEDASGLLTLGAQE